MHYALKEYLSKLGYSNIYCDFMPDVSKGIEAINLSKFEHTVDEINDGSGVQYIQIQVRRNTAEEAYKVCSKLFNLINSGTEEKVIDLTDEKFCVARPRQGPILLERGEGYTTYYCEIALWGDN